MLDVREMRLKHEGDRKSGPRDSEEYLRGKLPLLHARGLLAFEDLSASEGPWCE